MRDTIVIGMSGGVDSAVAASILVENGYNVEAVFMKNWDEEDQEFCTAAEDYKDALQACEILNIPLRSVDLTDQYWEKVFKVFLNECEKGRTPNPDILCNKEIKFRAFLDYALELGATRIATGHYAQIKTTGNNFQLLRGKDSNKDQSYFLYRLDQSQVSKSIFPIGTLDKKRVREKANDLGFLNHNKKDSTGICFIGERNFRKFLKKYLDEQPGEIISDKGTVIGEHEGLMYYTYGQRQGLGIGGGHGTIDAPWYVSNKIIHENRLVVVQGHDHPDLYHSYLTATNINWISGSSPGVNDIITSKIRYRSKDSGCKIKKQSDSVLVEFDSPQFAVAPGQSIVFYHNDVCIGGGIIENRSNTPNH
jgi:tRNA-specific 2-thiouridylase